MTIIEQFLAGEPFAVVGASSNRRKYGNKVLRAYLQHRRRVFPVHPSETVVEGLPCFPSLEALPERPRAISIITPPEVTAGVLRQAAAAGIVYVWMQPGAEPAGWQELAEELGLKAIGGGPCILVQLGYREE